ncbi:RNA polymerase [Lysinibacillus sp. 2017]|uniref:sigma-70 family RNA polymerase sigma factor n=1 Tax=unclassified Lysinibacillus TaxID=2636778 RepID=UPI000D525AD7|nr:MULTISPECIES: sigma-70 family RNA polymerase sigma factor [unclassified Lysinibacillus]AWE08042.1 RNA polymerase [Lysinibacillus sp. 2017]TGN36451.1 sigma-70 family RNA polymerase sigma factor [Lysinibacillus sp. S2017]
MKVDIEQIIDEYSAHLLRLAYFYTKNIHASEDIVQEVLIKFYEANYEEQGQLRSFLATMTVNKSKDYLKSWAYKKMQFETKWWMKTTDRDHVVQLEERSSIGAAILKLPLKYREPILLYYYEEMSVLQVAEILQINENTVKTRLKRARDQLRPVLEGTWEVLNHE